MKNFSFVELKDIIDRHLEDELSYRIEVVEFGTTGLEIKASGESSIYYLFADSQEEMFDELYDFLKDEYKGRAFAVKVNVVKNDNYLYIMIDHKVCVMFKYEQAKGLLWIEGAQTGEI